MTNQPKWGPWRLDAEQRCLYIETPVVYDIDLNRCRTKAGALGWIAHMAPKGWVNDAILAGLARALYDLFRPHWSADEAINVDGCVNRVAGDPYFARVVVPLVEHHEMPSDDQP